MPFTVLSIFNSVYGLSNGKFVSGSTLILNTLLLSSFVIFTSWLIAIPLGVLGAVFYNSIFDKILTILSPSSYVTKNEAEPKRLPKGPYFNSSDVTSS